MNWLHPIISVLTVCYVGVMSFGLWHSLVQEKKLGQVDNLHWYIARLIAFSLATFTGLWAAIASPKPGSTGDYVRWGLIIIAIAAIIISALIGRRPTRLQ